MPPRPPPATSAPLGRWGPRHAGDSPAHRLATPGHNPCPRSSGMNFRHDTAHPAAYSGKIPRSLGRYPHSMGQKSHARWAIRRREPHARHRAALSGLKRSQTSATEKTGTPASRADWPTYCEIFRPQSVGYLPALGVSPAHLMILVAKSLPEFCSHVEWGDEWA